MITDCQIRLGLPADVRRIAEMSRDYIEYGLGWRWTPARILAAIRAPDTNLAVACRGEHVVGFGLMQYKDDEAHLVLLAVDSGCRRAGVATALVAWLERCALTAGIGAVYLEARSATSRRGRSTASSVTTRSRSCAATTRVWRTAYGSPGTCGCRWAIRRPGPERLGDPVVTCFGPLVVPGRNGRSQLRQATPLSRILVQALRPF